MSAENQWFVKTQSGKSGPFEFRQLQYFADRGKIKPNTAISRGDSSWVKAKRVDGLYFPGDPPPGSGHEERPVMPDSGDGFVTQSSPFGIAARDSELSGLLDEQPDGESARDTDFEEDTSSAESSSELFSAAERSDQPVGAEVAPPTNTSARDAGLSNREGELASREAKLAAREADVAKRESELSEREANLARRESTVRDREAKADSLEMELRSRESNVACREADVGLREAEVSKREAELRRREAQFMTREKESAERNGNQ